MPYYYYYVISIFGIVVTFIIWQCDCVFVIHLVKVRRHCNHNAQWAHSWKFQAVGDGVFGCHRSPIANYK